MTEDSRKRHKNNNFQLSPLFWLPVELLEEISRFFSRVEAARVLTVNSTLHEVFARRIWRHIGRYDYAVWKVSESAWMRYGHLVRNLAASEYIPAKDYVPYLSNLLKLDVTFDITSNEIFEYEMPLLQQLSVECPRSIADRKAGALAAAKWVARAEERGQDVIVNWDTRADDLGSLSWNDDMLNAITKPEQHFVTLSAGEGLTVLQKNNATKLAAMLVRFYYNEHIRSSEAITSSVYSSFLANCENIFGKLKRLSIDLTCDSVMDSNMIPSLKDSQFPVLDFITFRGKVRNSRGHGFDPKLDGTFDTVTNLQLTGCDSSIWDIITPGRFSSVQNLYLNESHLTLDPLALARQFPVLDHLGIDGCCDQNFSFDGSSQSAQAAQLQHLQEFEMTYSEFDCGEINAGLFRFIVYHAPNLHTITFDYVWFEKSSLQELIESGAVNVSVRYLSVKFYDEITQDDLDAFIGLLPNLETLELEHLDGDGNLATHLRNQHPQIKIEATEIEDDRYRDYDYLENSDDDVDNDDDS